MGRASGNVPKNSHSINKNWPCFSEIAHQGDLSSAHHVSQSHPHSPAGLHHDYGLWTQLLFTLSQSAFPCPLQPCESINLTTSRILPKSGSGSLWGCSCSPHPGFVCHDEALLLQTPGKRIQEIGQNALLI